MLMLALRDPQEVADWLQAKTLKAYTSHAITSKDRLLVEFARIRANGWAMSEQQMELNYRGIAVPLLDRHGDLVGGLNVSMPMGNESSEDAVARVLPVRHETGETVNSPSALQRYWILYY